MEQSYFLVGGAGFVGSHFVDALIDLPDTKKITVFDNFISGKEEHLQHHAHHPKLSIIRGDISNFDLLHQAMQNHQTVFHFAANADISKAFTNPSIDFTEGVLLTHHVLEASRLTGVSRLIFTSGSGVYGEVNSPCEEEQGNLMPVSPYGASKLASEAFISSYYHMFGISACIFRLANIVGPRQTHGVGYDFLRKLKSNSKMLQVLGNGLQKKSYIHISDVINAVLYINQRHQEGVATYNVATCDSITVREIAALMIDCMQLKGEVQIAYSDSDRGWPGDVPFINLDTQKIRSTGWACRYSSKEAIAMAGIAMREELELC